MISRAPGIRVEARPGVVEVTLDRPERLNALTLDAYRLLPEVMGEVARDRSVRVVLFRGAGGQAFSAGTDVAVLGDIHTGSDGIGYEELVGRALSAVRESDAVTVAAVQGICAGGGLALAVHCDLRVATRSARFGYPIARTMANLVSASVLERSIAVFGDPLVREMLLLSRFVDASRAHAVGAVVEVVPDLEIDEAAAALVEALVTAAPGTTWATKRQLTVPSRGTSGAHDESELIARVYASADFRRGLAGFATGSAPGFGRDRWV